jgi:DNA repair exonuclease SbcCD ATPase subunit
MERLRRFHNESARVTAQREFEEITLIRLRAKITQLEQDKVILLKVQGLIDRAITTISANGIGKIESVVSGGLQKVFKKKSYGLVVEKNEGARGTNYELKIKKGPVVGEALGTFGGGISAVASFLLRVLMIKRFKLRKFIVVDESFNNVSPRDQPAVSEMLKKLVDDHGYTILMITHQSRLIGSADKVYEAVPQPHDAPPLLRQLTRAEIDEIAVNGLHFAAEEAKA